MTHPLIQKYSLPDDLVEQQVNSIVGNFDFSSLLDEPTKDSTSRIVMGKVLQIRNDQVVVDLGGKFDGRLTYSSSEDESSDLDIGDETHFIVAKVGKDGTRTLSRKNIDIILRHRERLKSLSVGMEVSGNLHRRTNIGWLVDIDGMFALLPYKDEHIFYEDQNPENAAGNTLPVKVKSINGEVVTLTREDYEEEVQELIKTRSLSHLEVGQIISGKVKNITSFGAFIQIPNSVTGLCHTSDYGPAAPQTGDQVEARILRIDKTKNRVSLGIRQASEPSWPDIVKKYQVGTKAQGVVTALVKYGAFVELEPGVSGLLHISDLSWSDHVRHPGEVVKENQTLEVAILGLDAEKRHIALGLKQLTEDPWSNITSRYLTGSKITGKLTNITKFGLFIRFEDGIEGLAHHTVNSKNLETGSEILVEVLRIDSARKKVSLALC